MFQLRVVHLILSTETMLLLRAHCASTMFLGARTSHKSAVRHDLAGLNCATTTSVETHSACAAHSLGTCTSHIVLLVMREAALSVYNGTFVIEQLGHSV